MSKKIKKSRRSRKTLKLKKQTVYTIGAIWLWIIALIITVSFFVDGTAPTQLRESLFDHIGWGMFGLPPFLITLSFLLFKVKSAIGKPNVPFGMGLMLFSLIVLTHNGLFGEIIWTNTAKFIAAEGALFVYLGVFFIGLIALLNASLDRIMNVILLFMQHNLDAIVQKFERVVTAPGKAGAISGKTQPIIKGMDATAKPVLRDIKINEPALLQKDNPSQSKQSAIKTEKSQKPEMKINPAMINEPGDASMWQYPPTTLLSDGPSGKADRGDVRKNARTIEETLTSFGVRSAVTEVNTGPAVTQYAIKIASGTKVSKITSLSSDLALALAAPTGAVRIEAPIPGRDLVGIEIPNRGLEFVTLKRMITSETMLKAKSKLAVSLGLDVSGHPLVADIAKMPHALVAGTTGSGKSVLINSWIASLLLRTTPQEVRLILIDPKRVEMTGYNGVPHLLVPVIVEPEKILSSLRWSLNEMQERYKKFAEVGVKNIEGFNELSGFQAMPNIVIFIDELADLMMFAPTEVEDSIVRLAQMARATGIHLVLATQRPSVDVITGIIKANIPTRIAFNVSSMIDSRVVLDMPGAEKLLGRGDMLYIPADQSKPSRIQGTFVSEKEVTAIVSFLKSKNIPVEYTEEVISQKVTVGGKNGKSAGGGGNDGRDPLFEEALRLVCQHDKASSSLIQRRLAVGYARAARIIDQLEMAGAIGPGEGAKPRDVLVKSPDEFLSQLSENSQS